LAYWNNEDYLGLGAGAHSYFRPPVHQGFGKRWSNFALPKKYIEAVSRSGSAESWNEFLSRDEAIFEFLFLGLRKTAGVTATEFKDRFGDTVEQIYGNALKVMSAEQLIAIENGNLRLTNRGLMVADSVIGNFALTDGAVTSQLTTPQLEEKLAV
jgi:oxygen-independent coproporphyrinogen-3 oxidase